MIVAESIEFHNVAELVPLSHPAGSALHRYSTESMAAPSSLGRNAASCSDGVELRFVTAPDWATVTLSARSKYPFSTGARVAIYRGDFLVEETEIPDGATRTLKLMSPPQLAQLEQKAFEGSAFSPDVWRIRFGGATVIFHDIDTAGEELRPPTAEEKPKVRWLAYGSSITNLTPGYVSHTARLLGVDVYNKGLCGSCRCEKETIEYLSGCEDWDFITLELGVNIRGIEDDDFENRVRKAVGILRKEHPEKPVVLINMFPNLDDHNKEPGRPAEANRSFRAIMRRVHEEAKDPNMHLIEGDEVLPDIRGLSGDMVHPTADGHHLMGFNLAARLRQCLPDCGLAV